MFSSVAATAADAGVDENGGQPVEIQQATSEHSPGAGQQLRLFEAAGR
nr:hypothetical protein [Azospirillum sp. 412522]